MSSFMFYSFDKMMAWTGYSFSENQTNLSVKLVTPPFFENSVWITAKTGWSNISSMDPYVITTAGSIQPLVNVSMQEATDKSSVLLVANDYNWYPSTVIARGAVVYDVAGNLICVIDFAADQSSTSGTFNIPFSKGIIRIR